ncbi:MAG: hypothetical protein ABSA46_21630 [Thermodesulfovibrionales bacterium]|jgi:thiol-disulfide isomerase/thioredoxin
MLLEKGLSKKKVLFLLYFITINAVIVALLMMRRQLNIGYVGLIVIVALAVIGLRMFGYVEILPSIKDMLRNHELGRKRKYFAYVIKKFMRNAAPCGSLEEIKPHLTALMWEYNFSCVKVYLYPLEIGTPSYTYTAAAGPESEEPFILSFPVIGSKSRLGNVRISKGMGNDYILCTSELITAISEELIRIWRS